MTVPRLLSPFVRTRTRQLCTLGFMLVALLVAGLPYWLRADDSRPSRPQRATEAAPVDTAGRDYAAAMAEARRTGQEVPVDTATTATSLTWARPDSKLRTTFHAVPQRAKTASGQWAPIDTTLARAGNTPAGLDVTPANAPVPVRFSAGSPPAAKRGGQSSGSGTNSLRLAPAAQPGSPAETALAEVQIDGHTITYLWPGLLPEPVLDGPRALYPEVLPGVDLLVVAREEGGFGQLLIVKNRNAATLDAVDTLTYGLRSATAVFRHQQPTNGVQILDPVSGAEIGSIPSPFAWDSAGREPTSPETPLRTAVDTSADVLQLSGLSGAEPGSRQGPMPTRLDGEDTGEARLHLDAAATGLLTDPEALFPLFLDPTLKTGLQSWATVYKQSPNTNTYHSTNFNSGTSDARVGYDEDTPLTTRSFWRMGFDSKIKGTVVSEAGFRVLNNHSWSCTAREMQLWLTGAISSSSTWQKQPAWESLQQKRSFAHGYGSSCDDEYVRFDVLGAAQEAATKGWGSITLGMRATSESDTLTWRKFKANTAELEVVHNRPPGEPTDGRTSPGGACVPGPGGGATIARTTISLSAKAIDPDGNLKGLRFRFWRTGTTVPTGTLVTNSSDGKASLTIQVSSLEDGVTYSWDVRAEDHSNASSSYYPPGTEPCRFTIDASAPPAPDVASDVWLEATPDGTTWSTVKFGQTGPVEFSAAGAAQFSYSFESINPITVPAVGGKATVTALAPRHAGPNTLHVYAFDAVGNRSVRTDYTFYVPPSETADKPGDVTGDDLPDLLLVDATGNLRTYAGDEGGELYSWLAASYTTGNELNPPGHWWDAGAAKAALIAKYDDAYPGDGITDLFARTPDGRFWLYPGDGYGSFDVNRRLRVLLPPGAPDPGTWTQIKAVGDVTGDQRPDLVVRAGTAFWMLGGYTGASFQEATLMEGSAWGRRDIVNVADVDVDGTPDLLWRNLDNGNMYVRHGLPGAAAGSVDLHSLKQAANSRDGDVSYGTGWTEAAMSSVIAIPDVSGDQVPDLWVRYGSDGQIRVYHPSATSAGSPVKVVLGADWSTMKSFG
ncbi:DNRLRE domain-containing protein [Micromonospora oryzae]|uniref:SWM_repeat domain-containing protein n=1 Tax=Micromonospora haikouensis TaxID=686309 RepID=A0A0D0X417_9ACTN|nr:MULTISPECIES: DNRLRE domain-containing protein [Micromonospora]KIR65574.1 SWM_repeat domain-containing protein [Micromonospora haikouensis]